jgi:hypothetical protein
VSEVQGIKVIRRIERFSLPLVYSVLLLISFLAPEIASAQITSLEDGANQLAERLAAIPNFRGPVRLNFHQESAASSAAEAEWKASLRRELEKHRLSITEESTAPVLRVALTQTPTQIVLTASAQIGERQEVKIVAFNRTTVPAANLPFALVRLERQLVYESPDRILDASSLWNGEEKGLAILLLKNLDMIVLRIDASGEVKQSISLASANFRLPRDPRAEVVPKGTQAELRLPTNICEFSWIGSSEVKCYPAKHAWRQATTLTSPCDSSDWKLTADGNDWTTADLLQAIPQESAKQSSAAVMSDFPGPVLSINGAQNPSSALIVIHNLQTGNYEVYKITLACGG